MSGSEFFCAFIPWIAAVFFCGTLAVLTVWFVIGLAVALWRNDDIDAYIVGGVVIFTAFVVCLAVYSGIKEDLKRAEAVEERRE